MMLPLPILAERVIPVARGLTGHTAPALGDALVSGGLTVVEVTLESDGGLEALESLADSGMTVGAGTITTIKQAKAATDAGASFLVSPHLDPHLVEWAVLQHVAYLPGIFTPTEAAAAMSLGLKTVKVFPASVAGPGLLKMLGGPFPHLEMVATGGISVQDAADYLDAGAVAVGIGGWLTDHQDLLVVTERARALTQVV